MTGRDFLCHGTVHSAFSSVLLSTIPANTRTTSPRPGGQLWGGSGTSGGAFSGCSSWKNTSIGIDVPIEGRRQMAEIDVAADPPLGPQPFDGGVHVDGVPGDDGIRDQV